MKICEKPLDGILVLEPDIVTDGYGEWMTTYSTKEMRRLGIYETFVQENQSKSVKNVLRGMHFQRAYDQAQLVRVLEGCVYDVVVDVRPDSPTFGAHFGIYLSEKEKNMIYMAKGFAHGFLTVSDSAVMHYKCSEFYHPEDENGILFCDREVGIKWPIDDSVQLIISDKDRAYQTLKEYRSLLQQEKNSGSFMQQDGSGISKIPKRI